MKSKHTTNKSMKKNPTIAGWLVLLALSTLNLQPSTAVAQGTAFTYQGQLSAGANAANGLYDLQFVLYDALSGGNQIAGPLTNSATAVSNGLFLVTLDFGGVFTGTNYWLDVSVRTNGNGSFTELGPRQALTAAPYALYAPNAGAAATAITATTALIATTAAAGSITSANLASGAVTVSNLAPDVLQNTFWNLGGNTGTDPTNGDFIGTLDNHPFEVWVNGQTALHIEGDANICWGVNSKIWQPNNDCSILGGNYNDIWANSSLTVIGGGQQNNIYSYSTNSVIGGGGWNAILDHAPNSVISGGLHNLI